MPGNEKSVEWLCTAVLQLILFDLNGGGINESLMGWYIVLLKLRMSDDNAGTTSNATSSATSNATENKWLDPVLNAVLICILIYLVFSPFLFWGSLQTYLSFSPTPTGGSFSRYIRLIPLLGLSFVQSILYCLITYVALFVNPTGSKNSIIGILFGKIQFLLILSPVYPIIGFFLFLFLRSPIMLFCFELVPIVLIPFLYAIQLIREIAPPSSASSTSPSTATSNDKRKT